MSTPVESQSVAISNSCELQITFVQSRDLGFEVSVIRSIINDIVCSSYALGISQLLRQHISRQRFLYLVALYQALDLLCRWTVNHQDTIDK